METRRLDQGCIDESFRLETNAGTEEDEISMLTNSDSADTRATR